MQTTAEAPDASHTTFHNIDSFEFCKYDTFSIVYLLFLLSYLLVLNDASRGSVRKFEILATQSLRDVLL